MRDASKERVNVIEDTVVMVTIAIQVSVRLVFKLLSFFEVSTFDTTVGHCTSQYSNDFKKPHL